MGKREDAVFKTTCGWCGEFLETAGKIENRPTCHSCYDKYPNFDKPKPKPKKKGKK